MRTDEEIANHLRSISNGVKVDLVKLQHRTNFYYVKLKNEIYTNLHDQEVFELALVQAYKEVTSEYSGVHQLCGQFQQGSLVFPPLLGQVQSQYLLQKDIQHCGQAKQGSHGLPLLVHKRDQVQQGSSVLPLMQVQMPRHHPLKRGSQQLGQLVFPHKPVHVLSHHKADTQKGQVPLQHHHVDVTNEQVGGHALPTAQPVHAAVQRPPEHGGHPQQLMAVNVSHSSPVHTGQQGGVQTQHLPGLVSHLSPAHVGQQGGVQPQHLPGLVSHQSPVHAGQQGGVQPQHLPGLVSQLSPAHVGAQSGVQPQHLPGLVSHLSPVHLGAQGGVQPLHQPGLVSHLQLAPCQADPVHPPLPGGVQQQVGHHAASLPSHKADPAHTHLPGGVQQLVGRHAVPLPPDQDDPVQPPLPGGVQQQVGRHVVPLFQHQAVPANTPLPGGIQQLLGHLGETLPHQAAQEHQLLSGGVEEKVEPYALPLPPQVHQTLPGGVEQVGRHAVPQSPNPAQAHLLNPGGVQQQSRPQAVPMQAAPVNRPATGCVQQIQQHQKHQKGGLALSPKESEPVLCHPPHDGGVVHGDLHMHGCPGPPHFTNNEESCLATTLHSTLHSSGCFLGFLGVCPPISPEIQVQTHILSLIDLLFPSSKADKRILSSHLVTIWQRLIVGDGDRVSKTDVGELQRTFLHQSLCACTTCSWLPALLAVYSQQTESHQLAFSLSLAEVGVTTSEDLKNFSLPLTTQ